MITFSCVPSMMMYSMMRCMMNEWYSNVVQCMYVVHMYRVPGMWYRVQGVPVPGIFNCVQCSVHHTLVVPGTRVYHTTITMVLRTTRYEV